jgi:hypothetical protein
MDMRQRPRFDPIYQEQLRLVRAAWREVLGKPDVDELWQEAVKVATVMLTSPPSDDEKAPRNMGVESLNQAMQRLVDMVATEAPALFYVHQQDLWGFVEGQVIAAAGSPELAQQILLNVRFFHWLPDNPIYRAPDGTDIVPPEATDAHIDQLKAHRRAESPHRTKGRPLGTGYYVDRDQFRADILRTLRTLIEKDHRPTQPNVADYLPSRMSARYLQELIRYHSLSWKDLKREARQLPHDLIP